MNEFRKQIILIVDDEPSNNRILVELLRSDYITLVATNGSTAIQIALSDTPPDLILLDVIMPDMDGFEVCRRLKADSRTNSIPIIFITAKDSELDEVNGFELGAVDYISKPFSATIVKARVNTHAQLKKHSDFMESLSFHDCLTKISNRRKFDEYLQTAWEFAVRERSPLSLILADIDYFKLFNDHYGHQAGDDCLIQVAEKLASSLTRKIELITRYGGEEFACILPKSKAVYAAKVAETFRENILSLRIPHAYSSVGSFVTISLGAATIVPERTTSHIALVKAADEALYLAKNSGRNKVKSVEI